MCAIYKPPQISADESLDEIVQNYMTDYRRLFIERPRVRVDGVYIAVCHYMYVSILEVDFMSPFI